MFLATAMELFGFDELTISEWALREGIVLDAIGHHDPADWSDDPRASAGRVGAQPRPALQLGRGPRPPRGAASRCDLFDHTAALHGLGDDDRELLEYAALLHDIGEHVSHEGHHRHAAYLVRTAGCAASTPRRCWPWRRWPGTTGESPSRATSRSAR